MATYVTLYKWTEQGIKHVKDSPERIQTAIKAAETGGGRVLEVYVTLGEYDLVAVAEWPDDETAAAFALAQAVQGYVQTKTLRAFTPKEFAGIVKKMP